MLGKSDVEFAEHARPEGRRWIGKHSEETMHFFIQGGQIKLVLQQVFIYQHSVSSAWISDGTDPWYPTLAALTVVTITALLCTVVVDSTGTDRNVDQCKSSTSDAETN